MADLATFLNDASLSHLTPILSSSTLADLEAKLDEGRSGFLTFLKTSGVTALKDRQSLTNALGKAKRERESGGTTASAGGGGEPKPPMVKFVGPNADCDYFGRQRGAHKKGAHICRVWSPCAQKRGQKSVPRKPHRH